MKYTNYNFYWPLLTLLILSPTLCMAKIWAVLIAGCEGNMGVNYASQASIYHAWHILRDHGVDPENIIVMAYDDIANDSENPHPGKVFNDPKGIDVYAGVKIDYRGKDVNASNFMAILEGDSEKTNGKPVLNSTEDDNVFIYNLQHGGHGILGFPRGLLTLKDLKTTLTNMNNKKMYKKMVYYLEACLSGSMFESWSNELEQMNIYAVTSSNGTAPSWGFYCDAVRSDPKISCIECHDLAPNACLGSDFSRSWMLNVDYLPDLSLQTIGKETEYAKMGTMFSPVHEFGNMEIKKDKISEFMGNKLGSQPYKKNNFLTLSSHNYPAIPINDATEMFIKSRIMRGEQAAVKELELLYMRRQYFDEQMGTLADHLLTPKSAPTLRHRILNENQGWISRMDCHHQVIHHFNQKCFNLAKNQYAMTKSFILNNFCELGLPIKRIILALDKQCANLKITNGIE